MFRTLGGTLLLIVLFALVLYPASAAAIPQLGVGTPGGSYLDSLDPEDDEYIWYFVDGSSSDSGDGFVSRDGSLVVWAGYQGKNPPSWWGEPILLFTNCTSCVDMTFNYDEEELTFELIINSLPTGSQNIDGYGDEWLGVNLGVPGGDGWQPAPDGSPFDVNNGEFWFLEGNLENYEEFQILIDRLFAVVGEISEGSIVLEDVYKFTPQTTGATLVPEPATLLLMGVGLMGMASIGRFRLFNKS